MVGAAFVFVAGVLGQFRGVGVAVMNRQGYVLEICHRRGSCQIGGDLKGFCSRSADLVWLVKRV